MALYVHVNVSHFIKRMLFFFGGNFMKWSLFFMLFFVIGGCVKSNKDHVSILNQGFHQDNAQVYMVKLALKEGMEAFIEYTTAQDRFSRYSRLFKGEGEFEISLIGLKPETTYTYIIHSRHKGEIYKTTGHEFTTGMLPEGLPKLKLNQKSTSFKGYILLKAFFNPGSLVLIDDQAEIIWHHLYDTTTVRAFNFSPDGTIISLVDSSTIEMMDMLNLQIQSFDTKIIGIEKLHHDIIEDNGGKIVGLGYSSTFQNLVKSGGHVNDTITGDRILVFSPQEGVTWEWDILDHINPLEFNDINILKSDLAHANSISFDSDSNFLVSFRNLNQVWKIDRETGKVMWKLGENGDFDLEDTNLNFIHQHDVHKNRFGDLMMFDNGFRDRNYSRILSLRYFSGDNTWRPVLNIKLDENHTTFRMGSARFINDSQILVSVPKRHMQLSVMDTEGNIVWNAVMDKTSFRAIFIEPELIDNRKWF